MGCSGEWGVYANSLVAIEIEKGNILCEALCDLCETLCNPPNIYESYTEFHKDHTEFHRVSRKYPTKVPPVRTRAEQSA